MTQYVGQHYVVAGHGRHRASPLPWTPGPALLAASGALAAAAVAAAALVGNDAADPSGPAGSDAADRSGHASNDAADGSARASTGGAKQRDASGPAGATPAAFDGNALLASAVVQQDGAGRAWCFGCSDALGLGSFTEAPSRGDAPGPGRLDAELPQAPSASPAATWVPYAAGQTAVNVGVPPPSSAPRASAPQASSVVVPPTRTAASVTADSSPEPLHSGGSVLPEPQETGPTPAATDPRPEPAPSVGRSPSAGESAQETWPDAPAGERPGGRADPAPPAAPAPPAEIGRASCRERV